MQLMSWPDGERYLHPPQSLIVSLLIFLISTLILSDWRCTVLTKFFDTQVPSITTEELVLPRHACCVLSRLCCNEHILGSYLSGIGRIENPSCSTCGHSSQDTSHLILHCPATNSLCHSLFGDSLSLYDLWSRPWKVARLLGLHGLLPCPILLKALGNQQQPVHTFSKIICSILMKYPERDRQKGGSSKLEKVRREKRKNCYVKSTDLAEQEPTAKLCIRDTRTQKL